MACWFSPTPIQYKFAKPHADIHGMHLHHVLHRRLCTGSTPAWSAHLIQNSYQLHANGAFGGTADEAIRALPPAALAQAPIQIATARRSEKVTIVYNYEIARQRARRGENRGAGSIGSLRTGRRYAAPIDIGLGRRQRASARPLYTAIYQSGSSGQPRAEYQFIGQGILPRSPHCFIGDTALIHQTECSGRLGPCVAVGLPQRRNRHLPRQRPERPSDAARLLGRFRSMHCQGFVAGYKLIPLQFAVLLANPDTVEMSECIVTAGVMVAVVAVVTITALIMLDNALVMSIGTSLR